MTRIFFCLNIFLSLVFCTYAQNTSDFADSICKRYHIPALHYAVISSDKIIDIQAIGYKNIRSKEKIELNDKFRIGSNTKTITSYLAAILVKQGKIQWNTKFFELYPELKAKSNPAYWNLTLQDFLTFRAPLISWTYTNKKPTKHQIKGSEAAQRYAFVTWILQQNPDTAQKTVYWSNPSYVAAGLMLEKAAGKDYKELVKDLGTTLGIDFGFGQPNYKDKHQTWGHNAQLVPEKPANNHKLNWLSSAGNINVSLADYCKFIQLQLQGLSGKSPLFSEAEFTFMHYGLADFSFGWNQYIDEKTHLLYSFHKGNPGTFLSKVYICKASDRAFLFFANVQSEEAETGIMELFAYLKQTQSETK